MSEFPTPLLDDIQKSLCESQGVVVIVCENWRHSDYAKEFVRRTLGRPKAKEPHRWEYRDRTIRFTTVERERDRQRLRGYRTVLWFTPAMCDELLGVQR